MLRDRVYEPIRNREISEALEKGRITLDEANKISVLSVTYPRAIEKEVAEILSKRCGVTWRE
ncbi:MAG: hypothetical protein QXW83_00110 [Nitrososphaerales archaeon]